MFFGMNLHYADPAQPVTTAGEELFRGTIVNTWTYGMHKNLPGMYLTIFTVNILVLLTMAPRNR